MSNGGPRYHLQRAIHRILPWLYAAVALSLPFSLRLYFSSVDLEVIFPAEPLIGMVCILQVVSLILQRSAIDLPRAVLRDPLVLLVLLWVTVLTVSALFGHYAMASFKALLVRTTFIAVFFAFPAFFPSLARFQRVRFLDLHAVALACVALFTLYRQSGMGYDRNGSALAPFPFYVDHTSYSAALVFALLFGCGYLAGIARKKRWREVLPLALLCTLGLLAAYLAYCRAAWLSLVVVGVLAVVLWLQLRVRTVLVMVGVGCAVGLIGLVTALGGQVSSTADSNATGAGFKESVRSLTNVQSDASNKERVNRWKCSLRMFKDSPWVGHGVGSYQFVFVPYQAQEEMTYISVTGPVDPDRVQRIWTFSDGLFIRRNPQTFYCSGGTAHSEYLLALSESGILAALVFAMLGMVALLRGLRRIPMITDRAVRYRMVAAWLAICAYFTHAFFNNYLDDPKVACLFWTTLGLLVIPDDDGRWMGSATMK